MAFAGWNLGHKLGCRHTTVVQASDLFLENVHTNPQERKVRREKWSDVQGKGLVLKTSLFWRRLQLYFRFFSCFWSPCWRFSLVMDWWMSEGDTKLNSPWSQVKVEPLLQPPDSLMSSEVIEFNTNTFYGWECFRFEKKVILTFVQQRDIVHLSMWQPHINNNLVHLYFLFFWHSYGTICWFPMWSSLYNNNNVIEDNII